MPFPALELGVGEDRGVKSAAQRGIWRTWVTDAQKVGSITGTLSRAPAAERDAEQLRCLRERGVRGHRRSSHTRRGAVG